MSNKLMAKLFQLIQLKKFNEKLNKRQKSMEDLGQSLMDLDLKRDSVVDDIKICRSDVIFIEEKKELKKFKCFHNNCGFKCRLRIQLKKHRLSHSNERQLVRDLNKCGKIFKTKTNLNKHKRLIHLKEKSLNVITTTAERNSFLKEV